MKKCLCLLILFMSFNRMYAQSEVERPKLVVGIVIDQMRWDYLYRYYNRYAANGGFRRLLTQGYSCENTYIPYAQSVTACGHASIYTGSVPAINGITGNDWYDYALNKAMYCVADDSASTIGSGSNAGRMSPKNLLVTTICDELRLATNFRSKTIGIAIKDRGSILPAGHSANAAYWFDNTAGMWISSSYYMNKLPAWVNTLNEKKLPDQYYAAGWKTMYPLNTYQQSDVAAAATGNNVFGPGGKLPYTLSQFAGKNYTALAATPHGNTFTVEMAKAAIQGEQLGKDSITDFLAISFSSPDYIGHTFGPNSVEAEDGFLKLDEALGQFLDYLDEQVGKNQYLVFLSADHGVAHVPSFLANHKIPAGNFDNDKIFNELNALLLDKFRTADLVKEVANNQVYLNRQLVAKNRGKEKEIQQATVDYLLAQSFIENAFSLTDMLGTPLNAVIKEKVINGYLSWRSGDVQMIPKPQWLPGFETNGTTHGSWNPYDAHIPLLWYGWHIKAGKTSRETSMADIAPTLCNLLHIQSPSGCVGKAIPEITQ